MPDIEEFQSQREKLQALMMEKADKTMKRFLNLDTQAYVDGALSAKEKELLGLISSLVLRCEDCINYHLVQCHKLGLKEDELVEALSVGLIVGGSITIPHIRRALATWDQLGE
ncbi:MAG: carboxymuconolactone decarboxylase family protein [Thermoplasmata archaeon]|nr:carboxymuconolactone decarboxylase family protein [Thermoplasmata archaeon]